MSKQRLSTVICAKYSIIYGTAYTSHGSPKPSSDATCVEMFAAASFAIRSALNLVSRVVYRSFHITHGGEKKNLSAIRAATFNRVCDFFSALLNSRCFSSAFVGARVVSRCGHNRASRETNASLRHALHSPTKRVRSHRSDSVPIQDCIFAAV